MKKQGNLGKRGKQALESLPITEASLGPFVSVLELSLWMKL